MIFCFIKITNNIINIIHMVLKINFFILMLLLFLYIYYNDDVKHFKNKYKYYIFLFKKRKRKNILKYKKPKSINYKNSILITNFQFLYNNSHIRSIRMSSITSFTFSKNT